MSFPCKRIFTTNGKALGRDLKYYYMAKKPHMPLCKLCCVYFKSLFTSLFINHPGFIVVHYSSRDDQTRGLL